MNSPPEILLDTHSWLWWLDRRERLSTAAAEAIEGAVAVGLSAISFWELGQLVALGRVDLHTPLDRWIDVTFSISSVRLIELTPEIAIDSWFLPGPIHRDPADRVILATARSIGWPIVTRDRRIRRYPHVETIW